MVGGTRTARMLLLLRLSLLLSLTMMQLVAGRVLPAAAAPGMVSTASSTPTPHIELTTATAAVALSSDDHEKEFAAVKWKRGRHNQKMLQGVPSPKLNILRRKEKGATIYGHRLLLGSAPPSCQGKCGTCVPCSPIHVSLGGPHGSLTQQEYYPEAWRCKCGNRFFMP